jgi:hypothetical protein
VTSTQPVKLTKDQRRADAKARAAAARADAQERARLRKEPLPAGIHLGRIDKRVAALRVTAGHVEVQTERDGPWQPLDVTGVGRGGWLWTRAKFTLADGSHKRVCGYAAGEQGLADVGQRDTGDGLSLPELGNDPISGVIGLVFLVIYLVALPFITVALVRHSRASGRLIRAVGGA